MHSSHPAGQYLKDLLRPKADPVPAKSKATPALDAADEGALPGDAGDYAMTDITLKAVAAVQEWAEVGDDDLDEGEGPSDRLFAMLIGIADENLDGEIGEAEAEVFQLAAEAAYDYLSSKGVSDEDITAILEDGDNAAGARAQELLAERMPDGDEAAAEEMDAFAFGDGSDESALDAVYKKKLVVRKGKKMRVMKRVSGRVRLSAKQKVGIRKMLRRSHSAAAQMRRAKSMRVRAKSGM